jgi:hypothetical protein
LELYIAIRAILRRGEAKEENLKIEEPDAPQANLKIQRGSSGAVSGSDAADLLRRSQFYYKSDVANVLFHHLSMKKPGESPTPLSLAPSLASGDYHGIYFFDP